MLMFNLLWQWLLMFSLLRDYLSTPLKEATESSETSVQFQQTLRRRTNKPSIFIVAARVSRVVADVQALGGESWNV